MKEQKQQTTNRRGNKQGTISEEVSPSVVGALPLENEGHERFCLEILNRKPNVRAYKLAYPDAAYMSAAAASSVLLKDHKIQERIAYLKEEQRSRLRMSADDVLMGLEMAARLDPADLYKDDGSLINIKDMPYEVRICIEKFESDSILVGEGKNKKNIGRTSKVHFISKKSALELLARHHKLLTDKLEVKVTKSLEDLLTESEREGEE
ncbi:terminase small subunit [Geobacter sp. SVR]|uniref:terminase small subunit n=1 Tax=Geobacter sp. SVR TaxID=2495594 RepID=UPI00143EF660|nr:terminase small subunit [Geobacter sp. SVR]BCS54770.1 hypothetical protein GSVR_30780 [Geobacter sp. SVR]GCF86422.1 hypothetical protein GSbR_30220 [Geobacter sp. SVR]